MISPEFLELDYISEHQTVRGCGGYMAALSKAQWVGPSTPSWEREADLHQFRRKVLLYWDGVSANAFKAIAPTVWLALAPLAENLPG